MKVRKATHITAALLGISAGIAGLEHGYFEILRGNTRPEGIMIASIGPPCDPEVVWNACEPAMTILPNYLITGILAVILGLAILIWSIFFLQKKGGGVVLMGLSVALLLFGGGLFPPTIGIVGGAAAAAINKPVDRQPGLILNFAAKLYPWPVALYTFWVFAQFPIGHFFNDALKAVMGVAAILILASLPLSVYTGYARDVVDQQADENGE